MGVVEVIRQIPNQPIKIIKIPGCNERGDQKSDKSLFVQKLRNEAIYQNNQVVTTFAASPHTNICIENNGMVGPAHFIVWQLNLPESKENRYGLESLRLENIPEISRQISECVQLMIKKKLSPIIYGYSGYSNKGLRGFSRSAQSNPFVHIHIAAIPKINESDRFTDEAKKLYLYYLPINSFLKIFISDLANGLVNQLGRSLSNLEVIYHGENKLNSGIRIHLRMETIENCLILLKDLGEVFNHIYHKLLEWRLTNFIGLELAKELEKDLRLYLEEFKINEETIDQLFIVAALFKPTLKQLIWAKEDKSLKEEEREKIELKIQRYRRIADTLRKNSQKIKERAQKLYNLTPQQLEILMGFWQDMFLDSSEDEIPHYTASENFPWKFVINNFIINQDNQLKIEAVDIFPQLFSGFGGNVIENLVDCFLERER